MQWLAPGCCGLPAGSWVALLFAGEDDDFLTGEIYDIAWFQLGANAGFLLAVNFYSAFFDVEFGLSAGFG